MSALKRLYNCCVLRCTNEHRSRDATIIDLVGTIIVGGIITVSRLLRLLCIYSFHNIKSHKHSLDIKVLFISAF